MKNFLLTLAMLMLFTITGCTTKKMRVASFKGNNDIEKDCEPVSGFRIRNNTHLILRCESDYIHIEILDGAK
jgi:hypothetical protein